ncbi:MAG: CPBP family intramembrane metalloprotease, partial [Candidatus Heimdallarchaeota archaeon]|nr:CPBP family intramembrane metalloprotease [Candidatus Heimdallarchaeota archaeon]
QCGYQLSEKKPKIMYSPPPPFDPSARSDELNQYPNQRPIQLRRKKQWNLFAGFWLPIVTFGSIFIIQLVFLFITMVFTREITPTPFVEFLLGGFSLLFLVSAVWKIQSYSSGKLTFRQRLGELGLPATKYSKKDLTREILLGILVGLIMVFVAILLQIFGGWLVKQLFGVNIDVLLDDPQFEEYMLKPPTSFGELSMFLLTMLFFIGVPEEIMFRGFVQRSFETKLKKKAALLLTAVFFAIFHIFLLFFAPPVFFFLFLAYLGISIILGVIRNWRGDLYACISAHIVYNIAQTVLIYIIYT